MISILRGQVATLCVLALALLAQLPHAAEVFMIAGDAGGAWGYLHGYAYAIALELAVLLFVVQERRKESYGFAGVSVLVNLAYYANKVSLFSVQAFPAWLISLALPIAIALYSHAIADTGASSNVAQTEVAWFKIALRKLQSLRNTKFAQVAELRNEDVVQLVQTDIVAQAKTLRNKDVSQHASIAQTMDLRNEETLQVAQHDALTHAQTLRNKGVTLAQIAKAVGKSTTWVSRNTQRGNEVVGATI